MELTEELKKRIDAMSYYDMLSKWRFAPSGTLIFQGESGEYWGKVMAHKRDENPAQAVQDSKDLGW